MTDVRWKRVRRIFSAALERDADRDAYLDVACGDDARLADEVRTLLRSYDDTGILPRLPGPVSVDDAPDGASAGGDPDDLTDMEDLLGGALAGRYEIDRRLGTGGMAAVYLARDERHDRRVALKIMRPRLVDRDGVGRFLREIRVTAGLHHPNILPLFDSGDVSGVPFYVMPYVEGVTLRDRIRDDRQLAVDDALAIASGVAAALDYAHGRAIVHRDIKPGNVLLRADATFVADFGIAFALEAAGGRLTESGVAVGTPAYMSPEQVLGEEAVDARTDTYALACLTYEMLAGEPPFTGKFPRTVMMRHVRDSVPNLTSARPLDAAVDGVFTRALAKTPADRYASAGAFVEALRGAIGDAGRRRSEPPGAPRDPTAPGPGRRGSDDESTTLDQKVRICTARDGVRIAYAVSGDGPPVVKAANWLSHLEYDAKSPMWRHIWKGISRRHTLVRYDERANGLSDWDVDDISFDAWVADLEAVVDAAGLDRFTLLGISKGGAIATAYAARHPERVERLVMLGAFPQGRRVRAVTRDDDDKADIELQLVRVGWGQENPAFRQVFSTLFFPDSDPDLISWFNDLQRVSASPENAARILEASFPIDVTDLARRIRAPTLVLHCDREERVPISAGRHFASLIPGAEFVLLPSRNHVPLEHEPAWSQFMRALEEFTGVAS